MKAKPITRGRHGWWMLGAFVLFGAGCQNTPQQVITLPPPGTVPTALNMVALPPYVIGASDNLLVEVFLPPKETFGNPVALPVQPISGQHTVKMDGTVGLGIYGAVPVVGLTLDQASERIRQHVASRLDPDLKIGPDKLYVIVDVLTYNTKEYYVITDGAGFGEQIFAFPSTGNETVLKALANVNGIPPVGSKRNIWVARRTPHGNAEQILPVDYVGVTQHGVDATNWQLFPGDRVYVCSEKIQRVDRNLGKILSPLERLLGTFLLGSSAYNSVANPIGGNQGGFR